MKFHRQIPSILLLIVCLGWLIEAADNEESITEDVPNGSQDNESGGGSIENTGEESNPEISETKRSERSGHRDKSNRHGRRKHRHRHHHNNHNNNRFDEDSFGRYSGRKNIQISRKKDLNLFKICFRTYRKKVF